MGERPQWEIPLGDSPMENQVAGHLLAKRDIPQPQCSPGHIKSSHEKLFWKEPFFRRKDSGKDSGDDSGEDSGKTSWEDSGEDSGEGFWEGFWGGY